MLTKFRGKSLSTGEWVYGSLVIEEYENNITYAIVTDTSFEEQRYSRCGGDVELYATAFIVDPNTVGQYINIDDKDEKEIYERDFVQDKFNNIGEVKVGHYEYDSKFHLGVHIVFTDKSICPFTGCVYREKVIGNRTDTPELLTSQDND